MPRAGDASDKPRSRNAGRHKPARSRSATARSHALSQLRREIWFGIASVLNINPAVANGALLQQPSSLQAERCIRPQARALPAERPTRSTAGAADLCSQLSLICIKVIGCGAVHMRMLVSGASSVSGKEHPCKVSQQSPYSVYPNCWPLEFVSFDRRCRSQY